MSYGHEPRQATNRVYVGNLSWQTTAEEIRGALERDGRTVTQVNIKTDARSGRSRGFAFADMGSPDEAQAAIDSLHGTELGGREIKVNLASENGSRSNPFVRNGLRGFGYEGNSSGRRTGGRGRR